jgi:RNA polymerase sigma-70 factor (ECF subfamily)
MYEGRADDDAARLRAWREGDRAAGGALFERYHGSLARFFHDKVSEAAQEDLIHETFLACLASAARFRGEARFRTFLFGIAHNVLADHLRRLGRRMARLGSQSDLEIAVATAVSLEPSPAAAAAAHEEQRRVLEALRRIPAIHRITLELHYWEGLSAAEVGAILGLPLGTVKTRLRDGRAHLEARLLELGQAAPGPDPT